jgi:hypothetical protein
MKKPSKRKALVQGVGKDLTCLWDMWMSKLVCNRMMVEESVSSKVRMINSGIIIKGFTTVLLEIIINDSYGDTSKFERSCHIFRMKGGEFFLNPLG